MIKILILEVVDLGFFTLAVAFGVTFTLMLQVPGSSALTDVPVIEQIFFVVTATVSEIFAPAGTKTFVTRLMVAKGTTLPFFMEATLETTAVGV